MQTAVSVSGLRELSRDFGRMSKDLRRDLRTEVKGLAGIVAEEAKSIAESKGLVASGRLVRMIRPGIKGSNVGVVRETAVRTSGKNAPFKYPAVYEFGGGGARAFLMPAVERKRNEVIQGVEQLLDRLADRYGF